MEGKYNLLDRQIDRLLILSLRNVYQNKYISYATILGLEEEFLKSSGREDGLICFRKCSKLKEFCNRFTRKYLKIHLADNAVVRKVKKEKDSFAFLAVMNLTELKECIGTLKKISHKLVLYIFDCWEPQWEKCKEYLNEINPKYVFFAYKKASEYFSQFFPNCFMLAQSMDFSIFHERNIEKRRLFMQMGRKTDVLHNAVLDYLESHGLTEDTQTYVYEKKKGDVVFPNFEILAKEICATKFFIAAPQCVQNSEYTGNISDVTARFYEAMACKTLIIGIKPKDTFDELFPYEYAMVEVDEENISTVVDDLLLNEEKYNEIVERNYKYLIQNHRWKNRYEQVMETISLR